MSEAKFVKTLPHLVPMLLLMTATFAVYWRTLGYDFIFNWDDNTYVFENQALTTVSPLFSLKLAFTNYYAGNYAPIQILSYILDHIFWGMDPLGYHLTNLIIHALNGLIFYQLLFKWSGNRLWAFAAAYLFLLHPVQVESVAWISQRKNLLAMFFSLIAFAAWQNYRKNESTSWYTTSLIAFLMAILSKSVAVIFPLTLLLYDCGFAKNNYRLNIFKDKLPFFAIALLGGVITVISQSPGNHGGMVDFHNVRPIHIMLTMPSVLVKYIYSLFWPTGLSALYDPPIMSAIDIEVLASFALLVILASVVFFLWNSRSEALFWYILFFLGLLPVSQIIPLVTLMNDRYLYFPMLGAAPFLVWPLRSASMDLIPSRVVATLLTIFLLLAAVIAWQRTGVWQTACSLWIDAVYKTPSNKLAWGSMIEAYAHDENLKDIPDNLVKNPQFRKGMEVPIMQFISRNDTFNAYRILDQLKATYPQFAEVWYLEGHVLMINGEADKAEGMFWHALTLDPNFAKSYFALGNIALERSDYESASSFYAQAEAAGAPVKIIAANQAVATALSGNLQGAKRQLERAFYAGMMGCEYIKSADEFKSFKNQPEFQALFSACQEKEK